MEAEIRRLRMENEFLKKVVMAPAAAPGVDVNERWSPGFGWRDDHRVVRS
jgi:hypothetical protein